MQTAAPFSKRPFCNNQVPLTEEEMKGEDNEQSLKLVESKAGQVEALKWMGLRLSPSDPEKEKPLSGHHHRNQGPGSPWAVSEIPWCMKQPNEREAICIFPLNNPFENGSFFFDRDLVSLVPPKRAPNLLEPVTAKSVRSPTPPFLSLVLGSPQNPATHLPQRGFEEEGREWTRSGILILMAQHQMRLCKEGTDG